MAESVDLPAGRQARKVDDKYYVYVIRSKIRKYKYVGITNNVERRISEHNQGKEKTTRSYIPFETILIEVYKTRIEARKREKYLKSGIGKEWLHIKFG